MSEHAQSDTPTQGIATFWPSIQNALADKRWDFRTIEGIARDTGLDESTVREVLEMHTGEVRRSLVPDSKGRTLYTLRKRGKSLQEMFANSIAILSKST